MNQLFKVQPPLEMVEEILGYLGISNFNENYKFSREDIQKKELISKILELSLKDYYINCKYQKYFNNLDEKKCVTILRQLVRIYNYKIVSTEKFSNGRKFLLYHLEKNEFEEHKKKNILVFD